MTNREPVWVWGLPFSPMTRAQAVDAVAGLIEGGTPSFFITANTHYVMLANKMPELRPVNDRAAFILADGHPLVWASRLLRTPLPERVAGSDLIYDLSDQAARLGHRLFLLGGGPGVADAVAQKLTERSPGLNVVGTECPPFRPLSGAEVDAQFDRIRAARPDLLLVASSMPRGEVWISENLDRLGVPVMVNVGASFDFVSGRIRRAPRAVQRCGMEWAFRLSLEPGRLAPRYASNAAFLAKMVASDLASARYLRRAPGNDSAGG